MTVYDLTGPYGWRSAGTFASNPLYDTQRSKLVLCNWQQYKEFKWLQYVPFNQSVSPLCTANMLYWNCEWEDIVLEHDRDDYISCMWWFMRGNTDTFLPHFNKWKNAANVPFFVTLRLTLCLQASHSTVCKIHFVVKKVPSTPQVIYLFQTQLVFRSRTSTSHHKQLSASVSTGFFSFWIQSNISCQIQIFWTHTHIYIYILVLSIN